MQRNKLFWICVWLMALAACATPPRTVKIALVAPFEGRDAVIGNQIFDAFRQTLRDEISAASAPIQITFVAYNDSGDSVMAQRAAHDVLRDNEVMLVIGHFKAETSAAAAPIYQEARLAQINVTYGITADEMRIRTREAVQFIKSDMTLHGAPDRARIYSAMQKSN